MFLRVGTLAIAVGLIFAGGSPADARSDPNCKPETSVTVAGSDEADKVTMQIKVTNTCKCTLRFRACDAPARKSCSSEVIEPGKTRDLAISTPANSGKADFNWRCRN